MKEMKIITQYKFTIICALIFCFIVSLAGCYSTQPETIDAKEINKQEDYEILSLVLKDCSKIKKEEPPNYMNFIKGIPDSTGRFVHSVYNNKDKASTTTDTGDVILQTVIIASIVVLVVLFILSIPDL